MGTIVPFLRRTDEPFDPKEITAMSMALDDVCTALNLRDDSYRKSAAETQRASNREPSRSPIF